MKQEEKRKTLSEVNQSIIRSEGDKFLSSLYNRYHAEKEYEPAAEYKDAIAKQFAWLGKVKPSVRPVGFSVDYKGLKCKVAFNPKSKLPVKVSA